MPDHLSINVALAEDFRSLSDTLYCSGDVDGALDAVVHLATQTIEHCDWAGITQACGRWSGRFATLAASDPVVRAADRLQNELQEGPSFETLEADTLVHVHDLASTHRWSRFTPAVRSDTPIRSALSLTVHPSPVYAALTLYSATPRAFTVEAVDTATLFAAHAQVLLLLVQQSGRISELNEALTASRVIGNAVGILMYAHRITSAEAFGRLTRASQDLNRRLFDLAGEVTSTGSLPTADGRRRGPGGDCEDLTGSAGREPALGRAQTGR